jgi:Mycothiol maleylpyruvate isomerase N-terminal domain
VHAGHAASLYRACVRSLISVDEREAEIFPAAARVVADLVQRAEVGEGWRAESACVGMTVGGLANHLGDQVVLAVRVLEAGRSEQEPITLAEHYHRAAWVRTDLDSEANVAIREGGESSARDGQGALVERVESHLARLPSAIASVRPADPVLLPWQGWSLTASDLLTTRMMEMVVHSDDLTASLGMDTPEFPDRVVTPVLALLTQLSVRRHGQAAVVRALSRPQRAPASISAF